MRFVMSEVSLGDNHISVGYKTDNFGIMHQYITSIDE